MVGRLLVGMATGDTPVWKSVVGSDHAVVFRVRPRPARRRKHTGLTPFRKSQFVLELHVVACVWPLAGKGTGLTPATKSEFVLDECVVA